MQGRLVKEYLSKEENWAGEEAAAGAERRSLCEGLERAARATTEFRTRNGLMWPVSHGPGASRPVSPAISAPRVLEVKSLGQSVVSPIGFIPPKLKSRNPDHVYQCTQGRPRDSDIPTSQHPSAASRKESWRPYCTRNTLYASF